jgi:hypothetical protein
MERTAACLLATLALALAAGSASPAWARDPSCTDLRGRVATFSVTPSEQQGTVVVRGRKPDGYKLASLRGVVTGSAPDGRLLLNHSLVFTHPRKPAARLYTEGDLVRLTPTADPCVLDVVEEVHLAGGQGSFADVDVAASSGEARGTIDVCTGQNAFDLTVRLCRRGS